MARPKRNPIRPAVIFLIGIILIALSFTFWYFIVSPIVSLGRYSVAISTQSKTISNASSLFVYFGNINFSGQTLYNRSRPVDHSLDLSIKVIANLGPVDVTVYANGHPIFTAKTNVTDKTIFCNSTLAKSNETRPSGTMVYPDIVHPVSVSLLDAFTGGTAPYMIIQNLNTTSEASISYFYNYTATFRNSDGLPIVIFIIGVIIVVIEGVALLRLVAKRVRER